MIGEMTLSLISAINLLAFTGECAEVESLISVATQPKSSTEAIR